MNKEEAIKNLKQYIKEDFTYREPIKNMSDFDRYCYNHCKDIETVLNYIEDLEETNEYQAELINDTYINYNDLEFTRIKRRNRELEQEIEELKKKPVNDISKQIMNEEIDIDSIQFEKMIQIQKGYLTDKSGIELARNQEILLKAIKQLHNKLSRKA